MSTKRTAVWLFVMIVCAGGCGGDDGGGDVINPPLDISGQWSVTATPTSNTCHPLGAPDTQGYLLALNGNQVSTQPEGDVCGPVTRGTISGDTLAINWTVTDSLQGPGQCVVRHAFTGTIVFTTNTLSGSGSDTVTLVSGNCNYAYGYPTLPCRMDSTDTGTRCNGCYGGCIQPMAPAGETVGHRRRGLLAGR